MFWELLRLLITISFSKNFADKIMTCVTTLHFTIITNLEYYVYFERGRILRENDLISPLLSILAMDNLR